MVFDGLEQVGLGTEHMALGVIVHCWDSGLRVKESEDFEGRDSVWTLDEILRLEVRTNRYSPFRGSSSFIEVPKQIAETKAIINVINKKDSQCFMWSNLAALYPNTSNPNKTSSYVPHLNKLNFDGISFPTPLNELSRGHYKDPVVYRGIDAPKIFIEKLEKDAIEIDNIYKKSKPLLPLTESEKQLYDNANNCCLWSNLSRKQYQDDEIKYLMHLDANNLYGYAMSKYLPLKDFIWSDNDLTEQDILNLSDESDVGYILEVDLEYPSDLHDKHSDFPLAPENKPPPNCKEPRLLTTLEPKTKYVLHYSNLKLYLKLGLVLKKINRVLKFFQSPWLKNYIDYNTKLRTKSVNDFQKDYYKLMNNSIFGKTMENVRRRVDIRLCSTEEQARKLIAKSNFNRRTIFSENLMAVHLKKTQIKFFKPIQVGMVILDISKVLMYSFHYEYMKHRYDSKVRLMYTDTDSFIYEIKTDDFYSDMKEDINLYDTSDYDENNIYNLPLVNKKKSSGK
ncbi:uncharacterized protein TNCV_3911741 [Trichonephila clavipes]|nr:uncharacterized protein TNCV_3911741 [Trichonephila clavipes]